MCSKSCRTPGNKLLWLGSCSIVLLLLCSFGLILSTFVFEAVDAFIDRQLIENFIISSANSGQYPAWIDSDSPDAGSVTSSFYVYNLTNPEEVISGRAQPSVVEIGPLVYS